MSVSDNGSETIYDDWKLSKVERETKGDISSFVASYSSKDIKKQKYTDGMIVKITVTPSAESTYSVSEYKFEAHVNKKLKVIDDVTFTMVK